MTSNFAPRNRTVTVPWRAPVGITVRKSLITSSGRASVAISRSVERASEVQVAHGAADQPALEAGIGEDGGEAAGGGGDPHGAC